VATLIRSRWMWWASPPFAAFPPSGRRNAASEVIAIYSDIEKLWDYANGAEAAGGPRLASFTEWRLGSMVGLG
jgi:hypothetical protein